MNKKIGIGIIAILAIVAAMLSTGCLGYFMFEPSEVEGVELPELPGPIDVPAIEPMPWNDTTTNTSTNGLMDLLP